MKKKGFTLIELLAVILILGIIALIAIPTINNILKEARIGALQRSLEQIYSGIEKYYSIEAIKGEEEPSGHIIDLTDESTFKKLEIKSQTYKKGYAYLSKTGDIFLYASDTKLCGYTDEDKKIVVEENKDACGVKKEIKYVEDLVELSNEVNNGDYKFITTYVLQNNIDFNDDASYKNPSSTEYGDFNKDGTVKSIKEEVTTGTGFYPIGTTEYFFGNIDGNNKAIKNLYINRSSDYQGLIGAAYLGNYENLELTGNITSRKYSGLLSGIAEFATFKNIKLQGSLISSTGKTLGLLGGSFSSSNIMNINASGTVDVYDENAGGIIGLANDKTIIKDSTVNVTVKGNEDIGGIVGDAEEETRIINCVLEGSVIGTGSNPEDIGGIVGEATSEVIIKNNNVNANIEGYHDVGGIIGEGKENIKIINSISQGNVVGTGTGSYSLGGIAGSINNSALIDDCQSNTTISGAINIGGIVGDSDGESTDKYPIVQNSSFLGIINITEGNGSGIGGIIGLNRGHIYNSHSNGTINISSIPTTCIGGIVGDNGRKDMDYSYILVDSSYFNGTINISGFGLTVGSLVGHNGEATEYESIPKYLTLKNSYSISNVSGYSQIGLIGENIMHIENVFNGGQVTGDDVTGNIIASNSATNATCTNCHSIVQTNTITNTLGTTHTAVTSDLLKNTVKLGNAFKYENGYYPLLYKRKNDGTYSNELVRGQTKIAIN